MVNRFLSLLKKDIITAYRNYFFLATIFIAILFGAIINFIIPKELSIQPNMYIYNSYEKNQSILINELIDESKVNHNNIKLLDSKEEVIKNMKDNPNSIGMIVEKKDIPSIEFILQGHENERLVNILLLSLKDGINRRINEVKEVNVVRLKADYETLQIPLNKKVLPTFLVMEPALLGFIMIAALIFMEKDEGTIKSYLVTPGGLSEYLGSKILLMVLLGWISTIISTLMVVGTNANYFYLLLLVTVGGVFASALGLIVASFFDDLSQSMIWVIAISMVLALPFISYFMPSFAPTYIRVLPTYSLLFAIKEAVFPSGNNSIIYSTIITFSILSIINYLLSIITYRYNLIKR